MVTLIVAEAVVVPEVPVTVTVLVDGLPPPPPPPPPPVLGLLEPHAVKAPAPAMPATRRSTIIQPRGITRRRRRPRSDRPKTPASAASAGQRSPSGPGRARLADEPAVTVIDTFCAVPDARLTDEPGEKLQLAPEGRPEQVSVTEPLKPLLGLSTRVT